MHLSFYDFTIGKGPSSEIQQKATELCRELNPNLDGSYVYFLTSQKYNDGEITNLNHIFGYVSFGEVSKYYRNLYKDGLSDLEIYDLCISNERRSGGYGSFLLNAVIQYARKNNNNGIVLRSRRDATLFYFKKGFYIIALNEGEPHKSEYIRGSIKNLETKVYNESDGRPFIFRLDINKKNAVIASCFSRLGNLFCGTRRVKGGRSNKTRRRR